MRLITCLRGRFLSINDSLNALRLQKIEYIKLPGIEFYRSLEKRYLDTSASQLTFHIGILNRMACGPSETRQDFVERLSDQILNVIGAVVMFLKLLVVSAY